MGKRIAKGKVGEAAQYMTRTQAIKKLQVSTQDFRRLCILKGIYPREPNKKLHGSDKTYYHKKDIQFLMHEPLMQKFRAFKVFLRKRMRLQQRHEESEVERLDQHKPLLTLDHLVRERYPSFCDALRDLDDALTLVHLFACLRSGTTEQHTATIPSESARLCREFQTYIVRERCLRKAFISVKGIYLQADIQGETITWLMPHVFAQDVPEEVDFRVMLTFLDFYLTMMRFVNFKLFHDIGLLYPPAIDSSKDAAGHTLSAIILQNVHHNEDENHAHNHEDDHIVSSAVFHDMVFLLSREVPAFVDFIARCGGALCYRFDDLNAQLEATVTHVIIDRPKCAQVEHREYVQPQWVVDSFNLGKCVPVHVYAPGVKLPAHLSPFVNDEVEGYVPEQRNVLNAWAGDTVQSSTLVHGTADEIASNVVDDDDDDDDDDGESLVEEEEIVVRRSGRKKRARVDDDTNAEELAKIMMTGKNKYTYRKLMQKVDAKKAHVAKLKQNRAARASKAV